MAEQSDIISTTAELIELIQEKLFGSGFEDFRNNRKLKIEISGLLQDLLELFSENAHYFNANYADFNWTDVSKFYYDFTVNANGINEEALWKFCKQNLRAFLKLIKT
jgi:hypothetical protein